MISKPPHSSRNEGTPPPTLVDTSNFSSGVLPSAFDAIGHTPLIHLQNLQAYHELECNLRTSVPSFALEAKPEEASQLTCPFLTSCSSFVD
jgi:hypothetical protein